MLRQPELPSLTSVRIYLDISTAFFLSIFLFSYKSPAPSQEGQIRWCVSRVKLIQVQARVQAKSCEIAQRLLSSANRDIWFSFISQVMCAKVESGAELAPWAILWRKKRGHWDFWIDIMTHRVGFARIRELVDVLARETREFAIELFHVRLIFVYPHRQASTNRSWMKMCRNFVKQCADVRYWQAA